MNSRLSILGVWLFLVLVLSLVGCNGKPVPDVTEENIAQLQIVTTAPTVAWLVDRVSTPKLQNTMIWPDGSELSEQQLTALSEADFIVQHGAGLDAWTEALDVATSRRLDLSQGTNLLERSGSAHTHGDEPEHRHGEPLSGTWHDPALIMRSLDLLLEHLGQSNPDAVDNLQADSLRNELLELSTLADELVSALGVTPILADDQFRYLKRRLQPDTQNGSANTSRTAAKSGFRLTTAPLPERSLEVEGSKAQPILLEALLPEPPDGYLAQLRRNLRAVQTAVEESA